jgi:hypothetical protein
MTEVTSAAAQFLVAERLKVLGLCEGYLTGSIAGQRQPANPFGGAVSEPPVDSPARARLVAVRSWGARRSTVSALEARRRPS